MLFYVVRISLAADAVPEWLDWMLHKHIPDVLATGAFEDYRLYRLLPEETGPQITFIIQYRCRSQAALDDYLSHHAPALRRQHEERFTNRFQAQRELWALQDATVHS